MKRIKKLAILVMCGLELLNINATSTYAAFDNQIINEELNANAKPDHIVLTWSDDPKTTQTIYLCCFTDFEKIYPSPDFNACSMLLIQLSPLSAT